MRVPQNRDFRLLWTGGVISGLGSWLLIIAVPVQVFRLTGSPLATGLTVAVESLPAMLLGPWAGVLVDHWNRRRIIVGANLASAAGVGLILLGDTPARVGFIWAGLLLEAVAVVLLQPATRSIVPAILGTGDDLVTANAVSAFTGGAMRLIGPPLGTALLAWGGIGLVAWLDAATYLVAAGLTCLVRVADPPRPALVLREVPRHLVDGLRHLRRSRLLRGMLAASWVYWAANAALTALLVPFVVQRLGRDGGDLGYVIAGLGCGFLVGSAVSGRLIGPYSTQAVLTWSYGLVGLAFLLLFNAPTLWVAVLGAAAAGVPGSVAMVATQHRIQVAAPEEVLGRVGAVFYASDATAAVAGALIAPLVVAVSGLSTGLNAVSVLVIAVAPMTLFLLRDPAGAESR
ncbi:MFS family permease [Allocatelliglobosispora scoriae]|uniref:MFS family permease n=1 Tax=Allocatelliglobosispora scoriae TaxID=643052 RepID=A0A841BPD7_9ACTN|nr:MFS transporter [Allocatelliglobosispora scoriae]MBB5868691.1 MFS family permease [Allocatelliglobosispora scoriae]